MHLRDFYYQQRVTEAQLDASFDWAQEADRALAIDWKAVGVAHGLTLAETGPASLSLQYASGAAYAKAGERCSVAAASAVDCSQDEYGVPTAVAAPGNTKWIGIFIRPTRTLSEPRTDGNGNEVYTIKSETCEVFVRQGSEGVGPARVPLSATAILLGEVELAHLQTAITTGDVDLSRREDWFLGTTMSFGDKVYGTPYDAVADLLAEIDTLAAGGGPFAFTSTWFGATSVGGVAPPPTTVAEAFDAIVYDLAQSTGAALVGAADFAGTYVIWAAESVAGALAAIATAADQHIGGAAPQHPATAVTFDDTNIAAAWSLNPSEVQEAVDLVVGALIDETPAASGASRVHNEALDTGSAHSETSAAGPVDGQLVDLAGWVADRPHKTKGELITGTWQHTGAASDDTEWENDVQACARWDLSTSGGAVGPAATVADLERGLGRLAKEGAVFYPYMWGNPRAKVNRADLGAIHVDKLAVVNVQRDHANLPEAGMVSRVIVAGGRSSATIYLNDVYAIYETPSTIDLSAHLPSGGGEDWRIQSLCGAGNGYLGVMFVNVTPAPNETHRVHLFKLEHDSIGGYTATPNPTFPATGIALPGTGPEQLAGTLDVCSEIIASPSGTYLITLNGWNAASGNEIVSVITILSAAIVSGRGDAPNSATCVPTGGLVCGPQAVYFTTYDTGTTTASVCSANTSNPGLSGDGDFPYTLGVTVNQLCTSLCHDGSMLYAPLYDGNVKTWCHEADADATLSAGTIVIGSLMACAFDGRNVWFSEYVAGNANLIGVDVGRIRSGSATTMDAAGARKFFMTRDAEAVSGPLLMGRLLFDGGAILMVFDTEDGEAMSGIYGRLACAADRT